MGGSQQLILGLKIKFCRGIGYPFHTLSILYEKIDQIKQQSFFRLLRTTRMWYVHYCGINSFCFDLYFSIMKGDTLKYFSIRSQHWFSLPWTQNLDFVFATNKQFADLLNSNIICYTRTDIGHNYYWTGIPSICRTSW